jgi:REP element-mobilizing transposase RayT
VRTDGTGLVEFNGAADHVRLLVNLPPAAAISCLVNRLKGVRATAVVRLPLRWLGRRSAA